VKALVHAEVLKLRSTRTPAWLLLATLGLVVLTVVVNVPKVGAKNAPVSLDDPGLLAGTVGIGFGVPEVMVVLLGVLAFTQEFRYGTATSTYLGEPRRTRVLVAKWLSLALSSVVITAATLALSVTFGIALIRSRDGDVTAAAQFWQMVAAGFVVMAAYGVIGVAVGALVRNQITAAVGVLVWMLAVEQIVIPAFPAVGRWMPGGATNALLQLGPAINADGKLLSTSVGGLVLVGYTAAAATLALVVAPRRDVL
jgi:ABC-2 type transport system permease protein